VAAGLVSAPPAKENAGGRWLGVRTTSDYDSGQELQCRHPVGGW